MQYDLSDLKTVRIFLNRINHQLRNNLSVSLSVVDDLIDGYQLSPEEIRDSKKSLEQALGLLKFFEPMISSLEQGTEKISLSRLLFQQLEESPLKKVFSSDFGGKEVFINADEKAVSNSLRYFFLYLNSKIPLPLKNNQNFNITFSEVIGKYILSAKIPARFLKRENLEKVNFSNLISYLEVDSSMEALGLIYIQDAMMKNNIGVISLTYLKNEELLLLELDYFC